ncbi:hypothetical protein K2X89_11380 [Myxococcota bacterium]|nr:hypothetical protein [Myxococcota bacterium]
MSMRHVIYGDIVSRESIALVLALGAMELEFDFVAETPALSLALASRAGRESGPYLRTPEGFLLGGLAGILDYLERVHSERTWRPRRPVSRVCCRLLEDWIELWLPLWPERSAAIVEGLAVHLAQSEFLLGRRPCRADGSLAAWLEADVLVDVALRGHVEARTPGLLAYGQRVREAVRSATAASIEDDAIPISLLALLRELAHDYHGYLEANRAALVDGEERVALDLGFGPMVLPVWSEHEARRAAIGAEMAALPGAARRGVRQMLEPLGAWRALVLPKAIGELELGDPRSL